MSPLRGLVGVSSYGSNDFYNVPPWKHTATSVFDISNVSKLPRLAILFACADMSPDLIDASVNNGAKGIVIAGVGNVDKPSLEAASRAVKKGVVVVRSSRVALGTVGRNVEINDDQLGFVASDELNPQSRILLSLALLKSRPASELQQLFLRTDKRTAHGGQPISAMKALLLLAVIPLVVAPPCSRSQEAPQSNREPTPQEAQDSAQAPSNSNSGQTQNTNATSPNGTLVNTEEAGESDDIEIPRKFAHWNEYQGPYFGIRAGAGLYMNSQRMLKTSRANNSSPYPDFKLRDFRFLLRGNLTSGSINRDQRRYLFVRTALSFWMS
jgi:hypothetical protein